MLKLILSNIRVRPTRTCVSILAVSLGVVLILVSVGLSYGQLTDSAERTRSVGGEFLLQPPESSLFFALNSATLSTEFQEVIDQVDGVGASTPVLVKFLGDRFHVVFGVDRESFDRVSGGLTFQGGRMFEEPYEAVIDTIYAKTHAVGVGDSLELLGHTFHIAGVFHQGVGTRVMVPLPTLQELNGTPEMATMFFIRKQEQASMEEVERLLNARFDGYKINRTEDLHELMTTTTPVFREFVTAVVVLSVAISFLIILLAMYSTITERTREIGILKSLGASRTYIVRLILKESLLICVLGVVVGFILTWIAIKLIVMTFPNLPIDITLLWRTVAAAMAILGGVLGALYPAVKAAKLDPVKALGYE